MAQFLYKAKDNQGENRNGEVESADTTSAAAMLRKKGLIVISLKSKSEQGNKFLNDFLNKVSFTELVIITRQLATMVTSGLVLSEALDILQEQQTNKGLKKALEEISIDVKGGLTLAQSLGKHSNIFPHLYVNLIKSGEASGKLDQVLLQMADSMEKDREFRARIKGAMVYPVVVISMMFVVGIIMMIFVIPKLLSLYTQSSIDLPLPTKILIGTSNLFVNYWWLALIIIAGLSFGIYKWNKTTQGSLVIGEILLKTPLIGKILTAVNLTNFNRTFGMLTSAGIPLLEAIGIVSDLTDNPVFQKVLKNAYLGVEKGLPFSAVIASDYFPKIVSQMIRVGEETGKIDEIFFKLADFFESESDHMVKNLTVAIEPIILIILGVGVGFMVISIILPIYKLTTSF